MSTAVVVVIVVLALLIIAALLAFQPVMRRRRLRERFGPEYDRIVADRGSRREAEQELTERERRVSHFELRALEPGKREQYAQEWLRLQERFVDDPSATVGSADTLVTALMGERGYPTERYEQQLADLSVKHAGVLDHYRSAHDLSTRAADGSASTEDLRQAMVHYRQLFTDLLEDNDATPKVEERKS
jgi:hypothetical protein